MGDDAKGGAGHIATMAKPADKVSRAGRSRFQALCAWMARRRAEEGPLWGSDPGDAHWAGNDALMAGSTVASPQAGPLLHVPPAPRSGTLERRNARSSHTPTRSHPRKRGPCSTLRRVADFGRNPGTGIGISNDNPGLARVLAQGIVARLAHIPDRGGGSLRALSQNRDSASRVSLC